MRSSARKSRRVAAVDVGFGRVAWAGFAAGGDGEMVLEEFVVSAREVGASGEGVGLDEMLGDVAKGGCTGSVFLGVPGHLALTKFVRTPAIAKAKRAKVVRFEASQNIPYPLEEVAWDHVVAAEDGNEIEWMLAAAKGEAMGELCAAVERRGFDVARAVPGSMALLACYRFNYAEVSESALIVELGTRTTQLVFVDPARFFVRTLVLAANGGGAELAARLQGEISRSMLGARQHGTKIEPRRILVTGEKAGEPEFAGKLGELAKLPVERFDPLRKVTVATAAEKGGAREESRYLAGVIGLAVLQVGAGLAPDLRPETFRAEARARRRRPRWIGLAAVLVVTPLVAAGYYRWAAEEATRATAEIEARLAPTRAAERQVAAKREKLEIGRARAERLRRVTDARTEWVRLLAKLQEDLGAVGDVWLDRVRIEDSETDAGPLRLGLSGRILDRMRPNERARANSYERVRQLLERFEQSDRVAAVESRRFDNSRAGILGFDVTLVLRGRKTK